MNGIIVIIIIVSFIIKVVKDEKKKDAKRQKGQPVRQGQQPMRQQTQQRPRNDAYYMQQQRATKERLQQKYRQQSSANNASNEDILSRARKNVKENEPGAIQQELHAKVCTEYRSHADAAPNLTTHMEHSLACSFDMEGDAMKRVNDLIVMGYSGDMEFERDFIAEGVEMLNSFSL